nr:DUF2752 domain-containing protein [uncultured Butyrivibrio sp.]
MEKDIKTILFRIKIDIKNNALMLLTIFVLWVAMNLIFHRFCPFVLFCGLPCPGCGITRAFFLFLSFHPIKALELNPSYPFWLMLGLAAFWQRYIKGYEHVKLFYPMLITAIITFVVYIIRIIYVFPAHEPMVYVHDNLLAHIFPAYDRIMTSLMDYILTNIE